MLSWEERKDIWRLKKEKKYDEIFDKYGKKIYYRKTSKKQRKKVNEQLVKDHNFDRISEINNKRDAKHYTLKLKDKIQLENSKYKVVGSARYIGKRFWHNSKVRDTTISLVLARIAIIGLMAMSIRQGTTNGYQENKMAYLTEYRDYNKNVNEYSEYLKTMELDDFQIIVKIMNDMWGNIKGYGQPELNIVGLPELDLADENGQGVCRNMAQDCANKMNAINPEYNARVMFVNMSDSGDVALIPIERTFVEGGEYVPMDAVSKFLYGPTIANHAIVAFNMPGEELTMIVDPTNPGFGVIANGGIIMLNNNVVKEHGKKPTEYDYRPIADLEMTRNDMYKENYQSFIDGLFTSNNTINEYIDKYGYEAACNALEYVQSINDHDYVNQSFYK